MCPLTSVNPSFFPCGGRSVAAGSISQRTALRDSGGGSLRCFKAVVIRVLMGRSWKMLSAILYFLSVV